MDTCVLIPDELGLVLTLQPNNNNVLEMHVAVWSNSTLAPGTRFHPDEGKVRLDKMEICSELPEDDVSKIEIFVTFFFLLCLIVRPSNFPFFYISVIFSFACFFFLICFFFLLLPYFSSGYVLSQS